ncbi:polysaccharide deacetylase family protein [Desulfitobacterium metallireducens]|uniref:Polysaccharide deacetylase n=1 Tax=Desulfitobacterium metallireducens DSM 15288 TaxID=871968 RepID=W0EGB5_9FIRM|nr:polysaccharide deacetylase family protein [Desulfitobacterium metallireducens]AHF08224.1 polysaccharide deacetylase [Desulfitobacterium metallireducens DSM 15288]
MLIISKPRELNLVIRYLFLLMIVFSFGLSGCSRTASASSQAYHSEGSMETTQVSQNDLAGQSSKSGGTEENGNSPSENQSDSDTTESLSQQELVSDVPIFMAPPQPDPPQTPLRPFYELAGSPPMAPGLAMRTRIFSTEPAKVVYLTFDDGPSPNTPQILKILKDEGVHATFFVIGTQIQKYPDYLKQEFAEGNAIGNHTYSHKYEEIYNSPQSYLVNIKKNEALINNLVGIRPPIIRTPGGTQGHFSVSYYNTVDAAGYLVYDWNVSIDDAVAPLVPVDKLVQNVKRQVPGKDRVIMLMHDAQGKITTVEALPQIIQYLKQEGYTFGILSSKVAPILFPGGFKR